MKKTSRSYWESFWKGRKKIVPFEPKGYQRETINQLFRKYLPDGRGHSLCEIGAAYSSRLPYFKKYHHYNVTGIDYEKLAVEETNLIYQNMGLNIKIEEHDFFSVSPPAIKFKVLASFGFFEHFEDIVSVAKKANTYIDELGIIVTWIPNMRGLPGVLQKLINKKIYETHIPYGPEDLISAHENAEFQTLFCDYFGLYNMGVVNVGNVVNAEVIKRLINIPHRPICVINKLASKNINSWMYSPYVIYIGQRKNAGD